MIRRQLIVRKMSASGALGAALFLLLPSERLALAQQAAAGADDPAAGVENEKALQTFREGIAAFDRRDFEAVKNMTNHYM